MSAVGRIYLYPDFQSARIIRILSLKENFQTLEYRLQQIVTNHLLLCKESDQICTFHFESTRLPASRELLLSSDRRFHEKHPNNNNTAHNTKINHAIGFPFLCMSCEHMEFDVLLIKSPISDGAKIAIFLLRFCSRRRLVNLFVLREWATCLAQ